MISNALHNEYLPSLEAKDPPSAPAVAGVVGGSLSLSISNNDNEKSEDSKLNCLLGRHKNSAESLAQQVIKFVEIVGIDRVGIGTFTFANNADGTMPTPQEATKKWDSFLNGVLRKKFPRGIRSLEPGELTGRPHFHVCFEMAEDIRTGYDHEAVKGRDYRSASPYLRRLWKYLSKKAEAYGMGSRVELEPIKGNAEAAGRYFAKYVSKSVKQRTEAWKGVRMWSTWGLSGSDRPYSCNFHRRTPKSLLWRQKVSIWARLHGFCDGGGESFEAMDRIKDTFGSRWCFIFLKDILAIDIREHGFDYKSAEVEKHDLELLKEIKAERDTEWSLLVDSYHETGRRLWPVGSGLGPQKQKEYFELKLRNKMAIAMQKEYRRKNPEVVENYRECDKPDLAKKAEKLVLVRGLKQENMAAKVMDEQHKRYERSQLESKLYRMDIFNQVLQEMEDKKNEQKE